MGLWLSSFKDPLRILSGSVKIYSALLERSQVHDFLARTLIIKAAMADSASPTVKPAEAPPPGFSPDFTNPWSILSALKGLFGLMFALVALAPL